MSGNLRLPAPPAQYSQRDQTEMRRSIAAFLESVQGLHGVDVGVTTFNTRTGDVVPVAADYDSFFLTPAEGNALYSLLGHTHAAADMVSGVLDQARLGSGSGGAGTKFLADDQTYKTLGAVSGLTTGRIPYATSATALGDSPLERISATWLRAHVTAFDIRPDTATSGDIRFINSGGTVLASFDYTNAGVLTLSNNGAVLSSTNGGVTVLGNAATDTQLAGDTRALKSLILNTNNTSFLKGKTSGGSTVNLLVVTSDANNVTKFLSAVDAGGFKFTDQAGTTDWMTLTAAAATILGTLSVTGAITGPLAHTNLTYSGLTSGHALVASGASAAAFRALTAADVTVGTFPSGAFIFTGPRISVGDIAAGSGIQMTTNGGSGSTINYALYIGGVARAFLGAAAAANDSITGTAVNDMFFRTQGGAMLFSVDSGSSAAMILAASGRLIVAASTTSRASLNIPAGTAPTSPVDGDMWTTTAGLFVRINGSTVGPLS